MYKDLITMDQKVKENFGYTFKRKDIKDLDILINKSISEFTNKEAEIIDFIDHPPSDILKKDIQKTAENQRNFKSDHKYDLAKFGLSEEQIINDCKPIYDTFLN